MDYTSLYSSCIKKSFNEDLTDIMGILRTAKKSRDAATFTLINYFKGLPISYPATLLGVEGSNLDLDIHPQQAAAISTDHYTMVRSRLFTHPLIAHVQYVNIKKHVVSLNKFSYVNILAEKRAAVRLDLDHSVAISLLFDTNQHLRGLLDNISIQGFAIKVAEFVQIDSGTDMAASFTLTDPVLLKDVPIDIPVTLVEIKGDRSPYTYTFKAFPAKHQEQLLSRFVFQRQVEIIRILKETVD
ncbi:MAG TPA: hypothetical protein HPP94_07620 [Desulfuromonadales bacterium]|nr:hypothetical protein [Desulfuromonadales bacterium]